MKRTILKLAASAFIIGAMGMATANEVTPKMLKAAEKAASQALAAIKERQQDAAVRYAERAVLYNPSSAENRALLGQAYMQAGRFSSAETAFSDALRLQPDHGRAALGLGLIRSALGKNAQALEALAHAQGRVPAADLGLALALAGDGEGALSVLEPAARAADATAKTRQNLALAYALVGRWADARVTASQDVAPDQVDQRMIEWAKFSRPRGTNEQLASLLNVKPVMDAGMPSQLALLEATPEAAPAQVAAVEPQAVVESAPVAPEPVAEAASVSQITPVPLPESQPQATPVAPKPAKPYLVSAGATNMPAAKPMYVKPALAKPTMPPRPIRTSTGGNFVVQLGAFSSKARIEQGWNASLSKVSWLGDYTPVSTTLQNASGRTFYRLAISGFSSRIEAVNLCRKMRERGGTCFVRGRAGDAPMQWVKRDTPSKQAYASR